MNKSRLKKQISAIGRLTILFLVQGIMRCWRMFFAKRTILFVTNQKIRTLTLGPVLQICLFAAFLWICDIFVQSWRYDSIIISKTAQISKLESMNKFFEGEFDNLNDKLTKVTEYLSSVNQDQHEVKAQELPSAIKAPKNVKEKDLSEDDKQTYNKIKNADSKINNIHLMALTRIKRIENAISLTGLNIKKMPSKVLGAKSAAVKEISLNSKKTTAQGGPLVLNPNADLEDGSLEAAMNKNLKLRKSEDDLERQMAKVKFTNEIDYLMVLERLAEVMPFSRPMKNYYISSGFGTRADPLTGHYATHQGLDFVGPMQEKIISPSSGKVILAGVFSDYGNAVVIDHGFGITTRYGHLSKLNVKEGQIVKRGEVIAVQGSTGRSTGQHLHYEVRYKDIPLNPRKFLEAGELLFNDDRITHHANS